MTILRVGSTGSDLYWSPDLCLVIRGGRWDLVHSQRIQPSCQPSRWSRPCAVAHGSS